MELTRKTNLRFAQLVFADSVFNDFSFSIITLKKSVEYFTESNLMIQTGICFNVCLVALESRDGASYICLEIELKALMSLVALLSPGITI